MGKRQVRGCAWAQVLPEKEARVITAQVVQGLAYLNEAPRHIIHYDLKPANILFDSFGQAKITVRTQVPPVLYRTTQSWVDV